MDWYHEVDPAWLKARQYYITATEIAKLVPEYKRTLKADPDAIAPGFAALWAEKNTPRKLDPASFGPAARGHWMESYAVSAWNQQRDIHMHYWDDCIIVKGRVGFSPDAMDVEYLYHYNVEMRAETCEAKEILEIKSFEPAHHMKAIIAGKDNQEEKILIQIATAFHVLEKLEKAHLVFYCPGAPISMKEFAYTRDDLQEQIELVGKISETYSKTIEQCKNITSDMAAKYTEEEIYKAMKEEVELNRRDGIFRF